LSEIPVVMLTIVDDRNLGYALGASEYLSKPIDRDRLVQILRRYGSESEPRPVLVVEDDADTREMLTRTLEREGWSVIEAENGRAGLDRAAETQPGLVLLDLMMPEMDGFEMLNEMRHISDLDDTAVVVVTSKDLSSEEISWLRAHAASVVVKGANSRAELVQALERQIRREPDASEIEQPISVTGDLSQG